MATPPSPLTGGGGAGGGALATVLGALQNRTSNPGKDFSAQSAQLQGADPTMVKRQLESVNQVLGVLFVKTFQTLPNVANQISATMKQLSRAMKEIDQAANVSEVVGKSEEGTSGSAADGTPPINFSPALSGMNTPGPQPGL